MKMRWLVMTIALLVCAGVLTGCRHLPRWLGGSRGVASAEGEDLLEGLPERMEGTAITGARFETVLFAYDSSQIESGETAKIEKVADFLKGDSSAILTVEGHCDERGSGEYNMALGERRALAVRAYLVGLDIDAGRVQTRSYGEEQPADPGHDEAAWRVNRRAEFLPMR